MSTENHADVAVDLRDVFGKTISDTVELRFYNKNVQTLSKKYMVEFNGEPIVIPDVPANPTGFHEVFINPKTYRYKTIYLNVISGKTNSITEYFFINPDKIRPKLMTFDDIASKSYRARLLPILSQSNIDETVWNGLNLRNRATIFNLCAKMQRNITAGGERLIDFVNSILPEMLDERHRARIYARVDSSLLKKLRNSPRLFTPLSGMMHSFPRGWQPIAGYNSFKSKDEAGNIQFTLAINAQEEFLADIDLDDHSGVKHAFDVLKHTITGVDTDPYNIHQILQAFQGLDAEYRLI